MSEVEKLRKEREALLEERQTNTEVSKLKREIFFLRNPVFTFIGGTFKAIGKTFKGTFTILANMGDAVLKMLSGAGKKVLADQGPANKNLKSGGTHNRKTPACANKNRKRADPQNNKSESPQVPVKPKGVLDAMEQTMKNIDKEMNKYDAF